MMNKERKIVLIHKLIESIDRGSVFSLCPTVIGALRPDEYRRFMDVEYLFPELWILRPDPAMTKNDFWFPLNLEGMKQRRKILLKCLDSLS